MEWHRALRRFALRQTYLATRPSTTHVDQTVSEIDVMPLQAQAFGYTENCAGGQKRQSAFRLSEVTHDCIRLFGGENHRFVSAGRLAAHKAPLRVTAWQARLPGSIGSEEIAGTDQKRLLDVASTCAVL